MNGLLETGEGEVDSEESLENLLGRHRCRAADRMVARRGSIESGERRGRHSESTDDERGKSSRYRYVKCGSAMPKLWNRYGID